MGWGRGRLYVLCPLSSDSPKVSGIIDEACKYEVSDDISEGLCPTEGRELYEFDPASKKCQPLTGVCGARKNMYKSESECNKSCVTKES